MDSCTMLSMTVPLAIVAAATVVQPALANEPAPVDQAVAAFQSLCAAGSFSRAAILARAERLGWRTSGADAPKIFDPASQRLAPAGAGPLILRVTSDASKGEQRDACGIAIDAPTTGLAAAVQKWLGFQPSFAMGRSATYFAVRNRDAWQSGVIGKSKFAQAKAQGRYYSIMVLDRGSEEPEQGPPATIILLRVKSDAAS
jgi:hypothetical protein